MLSTIRTFDFKSLPIGIEIKDLSFIKEQSRLLGHPHKTNFYQIQWLTGGSATHRIDFREIHIEANELLIITSGQVCEFDTVADYTGKAILFTGSFFSITETDTNFLHISEIFNPVNLNKTIHLCPQLAGNLITLLEEELKMPADDFQTTIAQNYLRIILLEAERLHNASHCPVVNSAARRFYNAVEQHFHENRNTEYYIGLLGLNEKVLSKEVKALTGKTPKTYIDNRIILEAKRLLSYSDVSVKEICFSLGFDEPTNFNKFFRKHTGTTPMHFRESVK